MEIKRVYVIGDSISMLYGPYFEALCGEKYHYDRKRGDEGFLDLNVPTGQNNGDSRMVLNYLRLLIQNQAANFDVLLFNCGLHDLRLTDRYQVPPEAYRANLQEICRLLREHTHAFPIWVTTTPIDDATHLAREKSFVRRNEDVQLYNRIASEVMAGQGIPQIDLYAFTLPLIPDACKDHVHFNDETCRKQAAFLFEQMERLLQA